ncbi:MAG: hypothetical protein CMG48_02335 [Candidatus Marinimicrobia bacterium]|nr:hypothetical protein [Candidatus Neomarinimicrobiota bacterium]
MRKIFNKIISLQILYPFRFLIVISLITIFSIIQLFFLKFDFTIENLFPENDQEVEQYYSFRDEFGREDNIISLTYNCDDPFLLKNYLENKKITQNLSKINGISNILSISNLGIELNISETNLPDENLTQKQLDEIRNYIFKYSIFTNNLISEDGTITSIILEVDESFNDHPGRLKIMKDIGNIIDNSNWDWYETGIPVLRTKYVQYMIGDFIKFFPPVTIILLLVLYMMFKSMKIVLLPILTVFISVIWILGLMSLFDFSINIITYIVPTLVMIVGVADSVHILIKYNQDIKISNNTKISIKKTIQGIGNAILLTSLTTSIGFLSLLSTNIVMIKEFGFLVAIGVLIAFLVSIFLIPPLLILMDNTYPLKTKSSKKGIRYYILKQIVEVNKNHHFIILIISSIFIALFIYFASKVESNSALLDDLSSGNELFDDMKFTEENMGAVFPFEVIITAKDEKNNFIENGIANSRIIVFVDKIQKKINSIPEIRKTISVVDYLEIIHDNFNEESEEKSYLNDGLIFQYFVLNEDIFQNLINFEYSKTRISARIKDINSTRAKEIVKEINEWKSENIPDDIQISLTGTTLMALKVNDYLVNNLIISFLIAFGVIFISMGFLFKSLKLAIFSMIPNLIPILFMAAIMGIFDIKLRPTTAMTFAIAFGIAVDDTIHYMVRFRQELSMNNGDFIKANSETIFSTGNAIISTSLILGCGFLVMVSSNFLPSRDFGFLSAITMFGAIIGDLFFLPTMLRLIKPKTGN